MTRRLAVATAGILGVVLTGCGADGPTGERLRGDGPLRVTERWSSCADEAPATGMLPAGATDAPTLPLLDDTFTPVAVILCGQQVQRRPDGGQELVATERRAGEVTALVAALRLPDEPRYEGPCTLDMVIPPWLALLDQQGRWVRPGIPVGPCGKPRTEVTEALDRLSTTTVATRPVQEVESSEAAAAGCAQRWADLVAVQVATGGRTGPVSGPPAYADRIVLRLCVYQVPERERGSGKPAGDFAYGRILTPDQAEAVTGALAATGPVVACATHAGRFAVLRPARGPGADVYVELDGCRRVLVTAPDGSASLGQAAPALTELLAG
ncbi:hypothetical protein ACFOOK_08180 [Micromonospora krabiensis]|uniref:Uncharacterized protein n=1 Tax=Micromonospora krabiensis TaxID=307121 RepID=A0A1C3NBP1_9ACTN|nr:hypothetical protein [Micromonospora krabiensis]SBV30025.1 hypothetical protein GA0070620_5612 [Micromonospora krabiensis]